MYEPIWYPWPSWWRPCERPPIAPHREWPPYDPPWCQHPIWTVPEDSDHLIARAQ